MKEVKHFLNNIPLIHPRSLHTYVYINTVYVYIYILNALYIYIPPEALPARENDQNYDALTARSQI